MVFTLNRATEDLEQAQSAVFVSPQLKGQRKMSARKARLILEHGDRIQEMNSKQDQIDAYGMELWSEKFNKLSDIQEFASINLEGQELQHAIWNRIPNSPFKRFQEAFCEEQDFVVPHVQVQGGVISFGNFREWDDVKGCLASPDKVPDKLLQDLGLLELKKKREDELERLEKKYNSLQSLKKAWESAEMLERGNQRLRVVAKPTDEIHSRYPGVPDPNENVIGSILYSREYENGKKKQKRRNAPKPPKRIIVSFFSSAYAALRKTRYEQYQYENGETPELSQLQVSVRSLNQRFDTEWRKGVSNDVKRELTEAAETVIRSAEELLSAPIQHNRQRIFDLLTDVRTQLETRKTSGAMSKMVAAISEIDRRFDVIAPINAFNSRDRLALQRSIQQNEFAFKAHRESIKRNAYKVGQEKLIAYDESTSMPLKRSTTKGVTSSFRLPEHVTKQSIRPFSTYINATKEETDILEAELLNGNKEGAMDSVVRLHVIGKLEAAHTCIEHLKTELSMIDTASMARIQKLTSNIHAVFKAREIFPDAEPPHVRALYEPLEQYLQELNELIKEAGQNIESDPEQFGKFCEHITKYLDGIDVESVMIELRDASRKEGMNGV